MFRPQAWSYPVFKICQAALRRRVRARRLILKRDDGSSLLRHPLDLLLNENYVWFRRDGRAVCSEGYSDYVPWSFAEAAVRSSRSVILPKIDTARVGAYRGVTMICKTLPSLIGMFFAQMFLFMPSVTAFSPRALARLDIINSCPYCDLTYADLTGANLSDANLTGAALNHATLAKANLTNANLSAATLTQANLKNANLTGANLANADLFGANLSGATIAGADLSNAVWIDGKRCKGGSLGSCGQ